ncbi:hypothetical protein WR25_02233 [Diploscapter pachys]|uniref:Uncharacterized protein n=1 Tax=Diploscapter pachys TaxID=2018661 RepID=A0A2A2M2H1_9BILA|nr:hypothetical protein WR25_02233 [Diploscapter pachys]
MGACLTGVVEQRRQRRFDRRGGQRNRWDWVGCDLDRKARPPHRIRRAGDHPGGIGAGLPRPGHVGAGEVEQARRQQRQPLRIGIDIGEEARAVGRGHVGMVVEQFDRAADAGERCLEFVADRIGEVAQVARAMLDRGGHRGEIGVKALDLDRGGGRHLRHAAAAAGDGAGRLAQALDRAGDAAGDEPADDDQQAEDGSDADRDLAAILVQAAEQRACGARQQQHADDAAVHDDGTGVVDADRGGAAEPFEAIDRTIGAVAAERGGGPAVQRGGDFGQRGKAAAPIDEAAIAVEQQDRGERRHLRRAQHGGEGVRGGDRIRGGRGRGRRIGTFGQDRGEAEVDTISGHDDAGRIERRARCRAWPVGGGGGSERGALRDQLRFGLADERVFVDAQEHRAEAGQRRDDEQRREQDRAQPQARPVALRPGLQRDDHAPVQGPRR